MKEIQKIIVLVKVNISKWKTDNDPEAQKAGLAAHLNENASVSIYLVSITAVV